MCSAGFGAQTCYEAPTNLGSNQASAEDDKHRVEEAASSPGVKVGFEEASGVI